MKRNIIKIPINALFLPEYSYFSYITDKHMKTKTGCNYYHALSIFQSRNGKWININKRHYNKNIYSLEEIEKIKNNINLMPPNQSYPLLPF